MCIRDRDEASHRPYAISVRYLSTLSQYAISVRYLTTVHCVAAARPVLGREHHTLAQYRTSRRAGLGR
eukprot:2872525-Rhodomonas_salina.1